MYQMALVEIGTSTTITDVEIKILHDLIDILEPVKHAVDELCRRDATLLTIERIHNFVFKTLSNSLMENKLDIFSEYGNKNKMYTLASTPMQKLFGVAEPGPGEHSQFMSLAFTSVCGESSRESFKEEIERVIVSASIPAALPSITPNLNRRMVQKECEVFEASGRRPANLQTLFEVLLTIQPTFLLQNSGLVYTVQQLMHFVLYKKCVAEAVNTKSA